MIFSSSQKWVTEVNFLLLRNQSDSFCKKWVESEKGSFFCESKDDSYWSKVKMIFFLQKWVKKVKSKCFFAKSELSPRWDPAAVRGCERRLPLSQYANHPSGPDIFLLYNILLYFLDMSTTEVGQIFFSSYPLINFRFYSLYRSYMNHITNFMKCINQSLYDTNPKNTIGDGGSTAL